VHQTAKILTSLLSGMSMHTCYHSADSSRHWELHRTDEQCILSMVQLPGAGLSGHPGTGVCIIPSRPLLFGLR